MADETKAANHIDFTSKTYEGPALMKGKELLAETRAGLTGEMGKSLQHGWYYSGQLDARVIREADGSAKTKTNPMYRTSGTVYGSDAPVPEGSYAPGAPKEYMQMKHSNGVDSKFTGHLATAEMWRNNSLNCSKTKSRTAPDPTSWGYHTMSNF